MSLMKRCGILMYACLAIGTGLSCSSGSGPLAGGTGAGSPGIAVAVAFHLDTATDSLTPQSKARRDTTQQTASATPGASTVKITDKNGGLFEITRARLTVQRLEFLLSTSQQSEVQAESFDNLTWENGSIVVEGPFEFDAMAGTVSPSLEHLELPAVSYTGMRIHLGDKETVSRGEHVVEVRGTYTIGHNSRTVILGLVTDQEIKYPLPQPVELSCEQCTLNFDVLLAANQWLSDVTLEPCLASFGPIDPIIIDSLTTTGRCNLTEATIRRNILHSGKLQALFQR